MKTMFGKLLKILLILFLVILAGLLMLGLVIALDWPWWVGLFVFLFLAGLFLAGLFIRRKWLSYRENNFVQQIISQEEKSFEPGKKDAEKNGDLKNRWSEAMQELKRSRLKEHGNPLYVLPWYMVMGESGSGKTTAIESAGLNSQFAQINRVSGLSGTKNCDWWFFDEAIILDTAGRYAVPVDEIRDRDEWNIFLTHLRKYRKKEPINGLIVTVPVDRLLQSSPESNEEYGKTIRKRIEELMLVLGASFPIHVMVTKCDLIRGMTEFSDALPEKSLNQAMGLMNNNRATESLSFVDQVMGSVGDRLRDLRLILCQHFGKRSSGYGVDPAFFLFPEEFDAIRAPLKSFVKGAFLENRYQEAAFLRGIFFTSGKQEGTPYSHFLKELGIIDKDSALKETNKGLFLHDYFAKILPNERELYAPTKRALELGKVTKNLWLASYLAIGVALCGVLSYSFMKNVRSLNQISHEIKDTSLLKGDFLSDVIVLDRFRNAILKVGEKNEKWWIPRLGLEESSLIEEKLKAEYCKRFKEGFLQPYFTKTITDRMTHFTRETPEPVVGDHVAHLVRRINLLSAAIKGEKLETLKSLPQPDCSVLLPGDSAIPEIMEKLNGLYLYYLFWGRDSMDLAQEMAPLQTWLKHLVSETDIPLNWIVPWINKDSELKGMALGDFWGGSGALSGEEPRILPAYTTAGKKKIDGFMKELETALADPLTIAGKKLSFETWYKNQYLNDWQAFAMNFKKGKDTLRGVEEWRQMAGRMAGDQSPYALLFSQMSTELLPEAPEKAPAWLALVREWDTIRSQGEKLKSADTATGIASLTKQGKSVISKINKLKKVTGESVQESMAPVIYNEYMNALGQIAPQAASSAMMFQLCEKTFTADPISGDSPFFVANQALASLRTTIITPDSSDKSFWGLVSGPLDFLWQFAVRISECQLEEAWKKTVLVEIQGVSDQRVLNEMLQGKEGLAKNFVAGPAKAFITRDYGKGYQPKIVMGDRIRFNGRFLQFMNKSDRAPKVVQDNYTVTIRGLPTDVNDKAKIRPHETILELQCGSEVQTMKNLNYPVRATFNWAPGGCGDVTLKILVGSYTLEKKYTDYPQFSKFLRHFSSGSVSFSPSDFPEHQADLRRLDIQFIVVRYQFTGNGPVIGMMDVSSGSAPVESVSCWNFSN